MITEDDLKKAIDEYKDKHGVDEITDVMKQAVMALRLPPKPVGWDKIAVFMKQEFQIDKSESTWRRIYDKQVKEDK